MNLTINDIAKKAGVSTATVSRVLTGRGYVKSETRTKIEKLLAESNFSYTPRKKTSSANMSDSVLVITGDISSYVYISHIRGIKKILESIDKKVLIVDSGYSTQKEEEYVQFASANNFSGIIMLNAVETISLVQILKTISIPVVMVNRYLNSIDSDIVCIDNIRSGYMGTEYLIHHGHKKIAHLAGPKTSNTCQDRLRGYMNAMQMAGLPVSENNIFYGDLKYESGYEFGKQIISMNPEHRFSAAFCANDLMSVGLVDALYDGGLNVPVDFSLTCADNTFNAVKGRVKLTTVDYDPELMGVSAAEMLLSRIEKPDIATRKIVFAPVLTERDSVSYYGSQK